MKEPSASTPRRRNVAALQTGSRNAASRRPDAQGSIEADEREALDRVLTNPYYRGIVTYKGVQYDGRHERLVSDETWLKVQGILDTTTTGTASVSTATT